MKMNKLSLGINLEKTGAPKGKPVMAISRVSNKVHPKEMTNWKSKVKC
jgi:hypothetical protein